MGRGLCGRVSLELCFSAFFPHHLPLAGLGSVGKDSVDG
jgi:hypothetical protein